MPPTLPNATPDQLVQRLDWHVLRRLDGLLQGDHRTAFYGAGVDFADLREYQPGDDVRTIDWNVTARMDAPYVRQYLAERDLTAWMLLDCSSSMSFGSRERPKELVLAELVTTLARVLTRGGNRVGAVLYDNRVLQVLEPGSGRSQVLRLARELLSPPTRPRGDALTDLGGLLRFAVHGIRRRSLLFLVSDFVTEPGWERPLGLLAQRHDVVAIRLWDRREAELPDAGVLVLQDSETGEQLVVDTGDPAFRRRFRAVTAAREDELAASMRRTGVDLFSLSTEDDLARALIDMIRARRARR